MTWVFRRAGFSGLGISKTGINHCRQYILFGYVSNLQPKSNASNAFTCNWVCTRRFLKSHEVLQRMFLFKKFLLKWQSSSFSPTSISSGRNSTWRLFALLRFSQSAKHSHHYCAWYEKCDDTAMEDGRKEENADIRNVGSPWNYLYLFTATSLVVISRAPSFEYSEK